MPLRLPKLLLAACLLGLAGCSEDSAPETPAARGGAVARGAAPQPEAEVRFTEVAAEAGLRFRHEAAEGLFYIVDEMGPGAAWLDADGDGDLDAYVVQGGRIYLTERGEPQPNRFFRNLGDGRFADETEASGAGDRGYGIGCAAADYDNDGDTDLYVTNVGPDVLLENDGTGRFTDVTASAGLGEAGCSSSAAFVDVDRDGLLDLYVAVYLPWTPKIEVPCYDRGGQQDYCHPSSYPPGQDRLYRNLGEGRFADITDAAGIGQRPAYGLGVVGADFNRDGHTDLYVANDKQGNFLWLGDGEGRFREAATELGCAYNGSGVPEAGMGILCEDLDVDGDFDLLVTHFARETNTLYRNEGGMFADATDETRLAAFGVADTSFGIGLLDVENDGVPEVFIASGAVIRSARPRRPDHPYAEPNQLLRWRADGRFEDVTARAGPGLQLVEMSRGAVLGDYDEDGDVDVLVTNNRGDLHLLRNDSATAGHHWLRVRTIGTTSNRDGIGAVVEVVAGARRARRLVAPHQGYASSHDPRLHFGLGPEAGDPAAVTIQWPSGRVERWGGLALDRTHVLREGEGDDADAAPVATAAALSDDAPHAVRPAAPVPPLSAAATEELKSLGARTSELAKAGKVREARAAAAQWVERCREIAGYDHPQLRGCIVSEARLTAGVEGPAAADLVLVREIERHRQDADPQHPTIAFLLAERAELARKAGRTQAAEPLLKEALELAEANEATRGLFSALVRQSLAQLAELDGRWHDAARDAGLAAGQLNGAQMFDQAASLRQLEGTALRKLRDYTRAEESFREALRLRRRVHGAKSAEVAMTKSLLGAVLGDQGRNNEGEVLLREALAQLERGESPQRELQVAGSKRDLGNLLAPQQRFAEAEPLLAAALEVFRRELGMDAPATVELRENLERVRTAMQR
ncbi:MAG: FG-GAP-like repeat-containing protein [Planctomycetota bacterium]